MDGDYDIAVPDPAGAIASLSSLGYSVESAIADLADNSVSARATHIEIAFTWDGRDSWAAVVDDGEGMDAGALLTAMTIAGRGPTSARTRADLGRFGMGLKTASFSQARQLTVSSAVAGSRWTTRTWDLDVVRTTGEWRLIRGTDAETQAILTQVRGARTHGTVALWRRLRRFDLPNISATDTSAQKRFYDEAARVRTHLGMVFGRLLRPSRLTITVGEERVHGWDPFLTTHSAVQRLPFEEFATSAGKVRVEGFILPHPRRLTLAERESAAGPGGWLDQQGFYVYRRARLILAGDWLGLRGLRRDEKYSLARIAVDVPAELDMDWGLDVRKSSAVPPIGLRRSLERIARAARQRAAEVLTHRGRVTAHTHGADFLYAWRVDRRNGTVRCRVNREHPLVRKVLRSGSEAAADVRALIRLLEETIPVGALRVMHETDTVDDPEPFAEASTEETEHVARKIYHALISGGQAPGEAKRRLALMPPFDHLNGFWRT